MCKHIRDIEFNVFSKYGQDGVLTYIFKLLPQHLFTFLNMADFNERQHRNPLNFIVKQGKWRSCIPPESVCKIASGVKADIVSTLLTITSEIDLLHIHHGQNDFWLLKFVMDCHLQPKIICVPYNNKIPFIKSLTVPYARTKPSTNFGYCSCSLKALCCILPNYIIFGCSRSKIAYFVRDDIIIHLPDIQTTYDFNTFAWAQMKDKFWVCVKPKPKQKN